MRNHPTKAGRSIEFELLASLDLGAGICVRNNLFIAVAGWSGTHAEHREGQASACPAITHVMSSGWTARPPSLPAKVSSPVVRASRLRAN